MDLADKILDAESNELVRKGADDKAPDGYYTDDMGYWVEVDIKRSPARFAEYAYTRCRRLNDHLYYDPVELTLYNRHEVIEPTVTSILSLARMPDMITTAQAIWVYDKLKSSVPRLDRDRVVVAPGLVWNIKEAKFENMPENCITVGGEPDE